MGTILEDFGGASVSEDVDAKGQLAEYEEDARSLQQSLASLIGPATGSGRPLQSVLRQVEDLYRRYSAILQDNQRLLRLLPPSEAATETCPSEDADINMHERLAKANLQQELLRQEIEVLRREGSSADAEAEIASLRWQLQEVESEAQAEMQGMYEELLEVRQVCEELDASLRQSEAKREKLALDQQLLQSTLMETSGELAFLQRRPSGLSMAPDTLASEIGASSDEGPQTPSPHHRTVLRPWENMRGVSDVESEVEAMDSLLPSANDLGHLHMGGNSAQTPTTPGNANVPDLPNKDTVEDGKCLSGHAAHETESELERLRCSNDAVTQELVATKMELAELHEAHLRLRRAAFMTHMSAKSASGPTASR